jgi:hypothetical protein
VRVPVPKTPPARPSFLQGTQASRRTRPTVLSIAGASPPPPASFTPAATGSGGRPPNSPPRSTWGRAPSTPSISPLHSDDGLYDLPPHRRRSGVPNERAEFAEELAAALGRHLPRQAATPAPVPDRRERLAPVKLPKPGTYDGKPKTPFRPWWNKIVHYFRFYPETLDVQRIAFVGTLLTDEAEEWHQARDNMITLANGQDTWAAFSEAIRNEYVDPRKGATAHVKLKALKYKGDIKAYLTAFKALNLQAGSNGEALQDIIDEALPNSIIDVRFYQNPRDLRTVRTFSPPPMRQDDTSRSWQP